MPWEKIKKSRNIEEIYVSDFDRLDSKKLYYQIDKKKRRITYLSNHKFYLERVLLKGFASLPKEFSNYGAMKNGLPYYLGKMLGGKNVDKFVIAFDSKNSFRKRGSVASVTLNYASFRELANKLAVTITEAKLERSHLVDEFFHGLFPRTYKKTTTAPSRRAVKAISNLDSSIIEHLNRQDVDKVLDFFEALLNSKYKSAIHKRKLLTAAKIKVDDIALKDIINAFEKLIIQNPGESVWGDFLKKNLLLLDSKYVKAIPELNVMLGTSRNVDFGLVDYQGFLDIFEIKRPNTPLLSNSADRGNYYWNSEATKAVVQAEKYLYNAESKSADLAQDIQRETGIKTKITRPRAIVIMGNSSTFNENQEQDFRILRMALKNVEIIPYNELLDALKNQLNKVYID
ncbi:Shedu immune nuclease family protein [Chloroflexota bacterium]